MCGRTGGCSDARTDDWKDGRVLGWTDFWVDRKVGYFDGRMQADAWMGGCLDGMMLGGLMGGRTRGLMDGWTNGRMGGSMDGRVDERVEFVERPD